MFSGRPIKQAKTQHSLEGVSTTRGDLFAGAALPDASHQAPDGFLAAEGARVLRVLGDLQVGDKNISEMERGNRGIKN